MKECEKSRRVREGKEQGRPKKFKFFVQPI
jgi:hypothetical protein